MRERVLHALDLGMLGDWQGAKRSLENLDDPIVPRLMTLMTEQQRREHDRLEAQTLTRHELGNALSIAQANIEAMIDGILAPTSERLTGIRDALQTCGALLDDLKRQYLPIGENRPNGDDINLCELISTQIDLISNIAESKNVRVAYEDRHPDEASCCTYHGDRERTAHLVRNVLLSAVRYTPPGGTIAIDRLRPNGQIDVSVNHYPNGDAYAVGFSLVSKLLDALGAQAHLTSESTSQNTFTIQLPVAS
jgi:signal transduction histidine kinase